MSTASQTATVANHPLRKLSRYQSVRKSASHRPNITQPSLPESDRKEKESQQDDASRVPPSPESRQRPRRSKGRSVTRHEASLAALEGKTNPGRSEDARAEIEAPIIAQQPAQKESRRPSSLTRLFSLRQSQGEAKAIESSRAAGSEEHNDHGSSRSSSKRRSSITSSEPIHIAPSSARSTRKDPYMTGALPNKGPITAFNPGQREVTVTWDEDVVQILVSPDTTAIQLAATALVRLARPNATNLIILESFSQLGLERPVRKYERVQDIMNSWDKDDANTFIIKIKSEDSRANGLRVSSAPSLQPEDHSVRLYHSQRPGRWDKKIVTLRSDGQITVTKKEGSETENICHLSDFDIYIPTQHQVARKIKPPRKCCLAIKSQQKSNIFLDPSKFVHFFSTDDQDVANSWYDAVQSWRSWYLVDILGLKQKPRRAYSMRRGSLFQANGRTASLDRVHLSAPNLVAKASSKRPCDRSMPPTSFPRGIGHFSAPTVVESSSQNRGAPGDNLFTPNSILGQLPSHKRPGTSDSSKLTRSSSHRDRAQSRSSSTRRENEPPKPLVDLTPTFKEAPQHVKKGGHGVTVPVEPGKYLIDSATTPDKLTSAIVLPSQTTFRRTEPVSENPAKANSLTSTNSPSFSTSLPHRSGTQRHNMSAQRRSSDHGSGNNTPLHHQHSRHRRLSKPRHPPSISQPRTSIATKVQQFLNRNKHTTLSNNDKHQSSPYSPRKDNYENNDDDTYDFFEDDEINEDWNKPLGHLGVVGGNGSGLRFKDRFKR